MGNIFETECKIFMQQGAQKLNPPQYLSQMIQKLFRSPFQLYKTIKSIVDKYLNFSYLLRKQEFCELARDAFLLDPADDGKRLYKLFKVKNPQGVKVVNVLEILSVIVLLANFGQSNEKDLMHNAELIEHKINLLLILFDLRDEAKVNVVEVMLMARTVLQGFAKLYPSVKFFQNQEIVDEIKPCILKLFTEKIEIEIKKEQEQLQKLTQNQAGGNGSVAMASRFNEGLNPAILSKQSSHGLGQLKQKGSNLAFVQQSPFAGGSTMKRKNNMINSFDSLESTSAESRGPNAGQNSRAGMVEETLAQKKARLFKWNNFQNVKIPLDLVKQQLLKNTNFIRFVSLFENFDQATMAWGCNQWFQQGVYLQKDFSEYYKNDESKAQPQEGDADVAYRELAQINSQADVGNDQILMFQTLLQKWQDQLNTNWSVNFEFIRLQQFKKCKYERKLVMEDPCIIMSMLNSQIVDIKANSRFATYISADGSVFVMGRDFRPRSETTPDVQVQEQAQSYKADGDSIYGIPKCINLVQKVHSVALGKNHMILMSNKGQIYGLGSNQYGQLGIPNQLIPTFYDHPMSLQKMYYSQSPMPINFFDSTNMQKTFGNQNSKQPSKINKTWEASPVLQIACGDDFSMALTQSGKLYTWGLMDDGRLGIRKPSGGHIVMGKNTFTWVPQKLQFSDPWEDNIDSIHACGSLAYCEVSGAGGGADDDKKGDGVTSRIFIWGSVPKGLNMTTEASVNLVPKVFEEVAPYNFSRIFIQNDFALGVGHGIKLTFELPNDNGDYGKDKEGTTQFDVLAIPTYDGSLVHSVDGLNELESFKERLRNVEVQVLDDFDVRWVQPYKAFTFPKVPKRKIKKQRGEDDSEEDEEEEEEDEEEEEEEDEEEDEEDNASHSASEDGSDNSDKKKEGSDDEDDDEEVESGRKSSKSKNKSKQAVKGGKGQNATKKKSKRPGADSDDDDNYVPYEEMTPAQQRQYDVEKFQRDLNKQKRHFADIERWVVPIAEAPELEEESQLSKHGGESQLQLDAADAAEESKSVEEQNKKRKEVKDTDEESGSDVESESNEDDDDEDENAKSNRKKKKKAAEEEDGSDGPEGEDKSENSGSQGRSQGNESDEHQSAELEEDSSDHEEEETAQQQQEKAYIDEEQEREGLPLREHCEQMKWAKIKKNVNKKKPFGDESDNTNKLLFVNYQFENSYNHILTKLIPLVRAIPSSVQAIVVSLPPDATFCDQHLAEVLQRLASHSGEDAMRVLFIRYEDKQTILKHLFRGSGSSHHAVQGMRVTGSIQSDSILYSWGNAKQGKLGISDNYFADLAEGENHTQFYMDDSQVNSASATLDCDFADLGSQAVNQGDQDTLANLMEFESKVVFTPKPQPIIGLMGLKASKIVCGQDHVLAMTESREVYSWGSNERGQLGVSRKSTEKIIQFSGYTYEDATQDDMKSNPKDQDRSMTPMDGRTDRDGGKNASDSNFNGDDLDDDTNSKPGVDFAPKHDSHEANVAAIEFNIQTKSVKKHYSGVPIKLHNIEGKIENIACGDQNSFAIVKI